jgi:hypothetical protein
VVDRQKIGCFRQTLTIRFPITTSNVAIFFNYFINYDSHK